MRVNIYTLGVALLFSINALHATTIQDLFRALDRRPENKLDIIAVDRSSLATQKLDDKLMPKVDLHIGYEVYNSPNGLLPVAPNKLIHMVKDQNIGQPFSKNIMRESASFSWPLFVKSIYTLKEKAKLLHIASKEKHLLNIYQRQAIVLGAVAQLRYLEALKLALQTKRRSILQTQTNTKLKVDEGRTPQSALFVLSSHINDLDISMNDIDQNANLLRSKIESLTGIRPKKSVRLRLKRSVRRGEIFALKPLHKKLDASKKGIEAANDAYYPSIVAKGNYSYSQADAYNNGDSINEHFGSGGIFLSVPLFDSSIGTAKQEARLDYMQSQTQYEQTKHSMTVEAKQITKEIQLLHSSIILAQKSVYEQEKLLKIAKVSLANEESTQEEYLRYEDALANAKAKLYRFHAKEWQDIAQLAVIYGNNLKGIVK